VPWQTKAGNGRRVEHPSKAAADAAVAEARERYLHGARSFRLMRVLTPDGHLKIIDFQRDRVQGDPALAALADATDLRSRTREAAEDANAAWHREICAAWKAGVAHADIARAAGTTIAYVRVVLRRGA
jgi:hypothetical protein